MRFLSIDDNDYKDVAGNTTDVNPDNTGATWTTSKSLNKAAFAVLFVD
jgi:hypothetical protein